MSLKSTLREDLKTALKQNEKERVSTLRLLLNEVFAKEKAKKSEVEDEEIELLVSSSVKKNKEAIEEFKKGDRDDLVLKTEAENKVLEKYLPEQLSTEELEKIIDQAISSVEEKNIGRIMAEVMPKVKGKADGSLVNKMVQERLHD